MRIYDRFYCYDRSPESLDPPKPLAALKGMGEVGRVDTDAHPRRRGRSAPWEGIRCPRGAATAGLQGGRDGQFPRGEVWRRA